MAILKLSNSKFCLWGTEIWKLNSLNQEYLKQMIRWLHFSSLVTTSHARFSYFCRHQWGKFLVFLPPSCSQLYILMFSLLFLWMYKCRVVVCACLYVGLYLNRSIGRQKCWIVISFKVLCTCRRKLYFLQSGQKVIGYLIMKS